MASPTAKENTPPKDSIKVNGCHGSIYENPVKDSPIPLYKATFSRTYVDQGEFKTVVSYREEDLPYLIVTAVKAWLRMIELKQQAWAKSRQDAPEARAEKTER